MVTITLKGREIPLIYTTWEMKQIQEEIAPMAGAIDLLVGRDKDGNNGAYGGAKQLDALGKVIRILGNAGLEEAGMEPDLTDKWVMRHIRPAMVASYAVAAMYVVNEGNQMEAKREQNGPVDEGLEEEQGKKRPGN